MGGLNTALSIASGALAAQEAAIETVNNNIANATTPGYSRETVNLSAGASIAVGNLNLGTGVSADSVTGVRDQLLDLRIQQQTSAQSSASAQSTVLASVQVYFSASTSNIGSSLSAFFSSLSALSATPNNAAARQTAISNAQDVVNQFHTTSNGLTAAQSSLNTQVAGDVRQINALAQQIASVNKQIGTANGGSGPATLLDQRTELERQLATLTDVSITRTPEGDTVTTAGSATPLVVAGRSYPLGTTTSTGGLTQVVDSLGTNITSKLSGGDLGGALQVRDTAIPGLLKQLDALASNFADAFNAAQGSGQDQAGNPGGPLFTPPSGVAGYAASITLHTTNGSAIAAASASGAPSGNGNIPNLTAVQNTAPAGGLSPTDAYAALVNSVGNAASTAKTQSDALTSSLAQLKTQQNSVSGVSIDEESANLLRFQQAYQASAEVISTIRSLFSYTIGILSSSGG